MTFPSIPNSTAITNDPETSLPSVDAASRSVHSGRRSPPRNSVATSQGETVAWFCARVRILRGNSPDAQGGHRALAFPGDTAFPTAGANLKQVGGCSCVYTPHTETREDRDDPGADPGVRLRRNQTDPLGEGKLSQLR